MNNIAPNLIKRWVDIRNNPEHWNQKFSLIEFTDQNGKSYWTKQYNFIPHWKRYKEAKDWIKNTNFPEYNCKIGWNANNEILLVTQNYFGSQRLEKELEQLKQTRFEKREKTYQRNNLLLDFFFYTGLRMNELINIKHSDYNYRQRTLQILGKGNKVRYIFLPPCLANQFNSNSQYYFFQGWV